MNGDKESVNVRNRPVYDPFTTVIVEAATNLAAPVWQPLQTNTIIATNGTFYFSDPEWSNYPGRFYRVAAPGD
jgi:hypothetical protein